MAKYWKDAKVNGSIVPTRDYEGFTGPKLKAGTTVIITDVHTSVFGDAQSPVRAGSQVREALQQRPLEVFAR